jgi:hypothetical protein
MITGGRRTPDHALLLLRCTQTIRLEALAYSKRNVTSIFSFLFVDSRPALHNLDRTDSSWPAAPRRGHRTSQESQSAPRTLQARSGGWSYQPHRACSRLGDITLSLVLTPTLPSAEEIHLLNTRSLRRNNSKHLQLLNVFPSALLPTGQSYHSPVLNSSCTYLVQRQTFTPRDLLPHLGNQMDKPSFRSGGPRT